MNRICTYAMKGGHMVKVKVGCSCDGQTCKFLKEHGYVCNQLLQIWAMENDDSQFYRNQ